MNGTPNGNGKELVPASIVQLIFNQTKDSIDANTDSIRDLCTAINELSKITINPQMKKDIMDKIEGCEKVDQDRQKEILTTMYNIRDANNVRKDELEELLIKNIDQTKDLSKSLDSMGKELVRALDGVTRKEDDINNKFDELLNKIKIFTIITSIVMSLVGGIHIWVDKDINKTIDDKLNKSLEVIIKSRPYPTWPPQIPTGTENEIRKTPEK